MVTRVWYVEGNVVINNIINYIMNTFPCWISIESVELGWAEVSVKARLEDMPSIEDLMAEYV